MRISPTLVASIGLAILAFAAPGKAHAERIDPDDPEPIAAKRSPPPEIDPLDIAPEETVKPEPDYEAEWRKDRDRYARWRLSGGVGVRFGSFTVNGDSTGAAIPFHLDLGARQKRIYVFGSYDVFSIDARVPDLGDATARGLVGVGDGSGLVHRLGATARYTLARAAEHDGGLDVWAEAGAGLQHLRWDAGGVWTRPDLALGIGASVIYLGKAQHFGGTIGLRVLLSKRSDTMGAPSACGGPCDEPTPPPSADRSFMFDISIPFGW